jgi:hypothetical protein
MNASHARGPWERRIRTIKTVLTSLFEQCPGRCDDASVDFSKSDRVTEAIPDTDGLVRRVKVLGRSLNRGKKRIFERSVQQLVILIENDP